MEYSQYYLIRHWTPTAIECYQRGCNCNGCGIQELISEKFQMKNTVIGLVKTLGKPEPYIHKARDEKIILEIVKRVSKGMSKQEIADDLGTTLGQVCYVMQRNNLHVRQLLKKMNKERKNKND